MFGETLLESSAGRKRKRWPMATAFMAQTVVAAVVVIVPLLSTGVIPLSARISCPTLTRLDPAPVDRVKPRPDSAHRSGPSMAPAQTVLLLANNNPNAIHIGPSVPTTNNPDAVRQIGSYVENNDLPSDLIRGGSGPDVKPEIKRIVSTNSEAQIISRVEPVYPRIAVASGVQGAVKLHAIIARNGRIESLELISGHPLLVQAAMDAVRQWRYRPYYLNGEAVEVETFITVNFRKEGR